MTQSEFQLIVPYGVWRDALMPLLARRNLVATGVLTRDPARQPAGLLIDTLAVGATPRNGADFPPLADWVAIGAPAGDPPDSPSAWIERLKPRFAQLLAIVLVGFRRDVRSWCGWTVERSVVRPLAGLGIVGAGMVRVGTTHDPIADEADDRADSRWSRLRGAVGDVVFDKLRRSSVTVVGCSRTGNLAAGMFAALGVRRLVLIDGDMLEPVNLDGVILATEADVGSNKAIALGRRLVAFRSDLLVQAVPHPLTDRRSERAVGGTDLIVTCVDQDAGRLRAAHLARGRLIPHLDIGTGVTCTPTGDRQLAADIRLLLPGSGCIRCVGGLGDLDQAEYELHAPPGALPRRSPEPWHSRGRLGSLVTLNSIAVATGVQSWLDLLDGSLATSVWHRLRWQSALGLESRTAYVAARGDCPLCLRRRNAA